MDFRRKVYAAYQDQIQSRINTLQTALEELKISLQSETKSTAGDKYETGRAMVHIEQENLGRQLAALQEQQTALAHIDINAYTGTIIAGSLVHTSQGYLFPGVVLGKLVVDAVPVFALSPSAPLGLVLMGKTRGDTLTFRNTVYHIEAVL